MDEINPGPLTMGQIEEAITNISDVMEEAVEELAVYAQAAAEAEIDYKVAYAKELLRIKSKANDRKEKLTVGEQDARALVETEGLLRARLIAEASHSTQLEKLRTLRSRLDALRSLNSSF